MIYELFPLIKKEDIGSAEVLQIAVNKDKTAINLKVRFEKIISRIKLIKIEKNIAEKYNMSRVSISPKYLLLDYTYLESVKEYFLMNYPSLKGYLSESKWNLHENTINIDVSEGTTIFFNNICSEISKLILAETENLCTVNFIEGNIVQNEYNREEIIKNGVEENIPRPVDVKKQVKPQNKSQYKPRKKSPILQDGEELIFGKLTNETITKITDLIADAGYFTIKGDVFFVETREIPNKNIYVMNFDITDYSSSVRVTKLMKKEQFEELSGKIKEGMHLKVEGVLKYSIYDKEYLLQPCAIIKSKAKERMDFAQDKRVELHLHTNMSSMDGVTNIKDYVKLAKKWGHKAIAVTDHGVVQAFPEAMNASKGSDVKIIYGVEAYVFDDIAPVSVVKNEKDYSLDDEVIIFDLETTGLRCKTEEIIEISAVTIKNGEKISEYHTYVNPQRPISPKITSITGITDDIVSNQPTIDKVIFEFVKYIGERPLVAHNADFDIGFLMEACRKNGIDGKLTSIDTVEMSRILLDNISRHRLNTIAKALKLGSFEHHRAEEDTRILTLIYNKFINMLKDECQIQNICQINDALCKIKEKKDIKKPSRTNHLIIIAKNYQGLKNLYQIVSKSHIEHFYSRPVVPKSVIKEFRQGLILGSACEAGELFSAILSCKPQGEIEKIAKEMDFLEVQPLANNQFLIEKEILHSSAELMNINEQIIKLGEKLDIPVVASGDVHFKEAKDEVFRRILMASKGFSDSDNQPPLYLKTTEEMLSDFDYLPKEKAFEIVVANTNLIADMCENIQAVPSETFTPTIEGSAKELEDMSRQKVYELYGKDPEKLVIDRLEYELKSIIGNGFDVMYMISQKLVSKSIENGYLVGSRGSVGSSFVAFLSGITEVNSLPAHYRCPNCKNTEFYPNQGLCGCDMPDKLCPKCQTEFVKDGFDIPFATFLGFDGDKAPDIDLNFSGEYQDRAHKHTEEIFGKDFVFRAGTIGTIADKTAYAYVKKYFQEREIEVVRAEENRLSKGCTGVKKTTGQHPGGLMIVPKDKSIFDFCPIQRPADDVNKDTITTHFDYQSIHDNLLKLDLLAHDDPTIIKKLFEITSINPQDVPLSDKQTMKIFTDISALGINEDKYLGKIGSVAVPEFGTKFVREMLQTTKPTTFDELVRISGLSHGTDVWLGNAYDLVANNVATLKEVICARDDIMNFLIAKGVEPKMSFTIMESVRKGKGLKPDWEQAMMENDVPKWYIDSCKKIKYMFPKAHAVAYVMMAFRIAWFKVHKPLAFYSAYFSIRAKSFDASIMTMGHSQIIQKMEHILSLDKISNVEKDTYTTLEVCHEFYLRGFKFLPIDIYKSDVKDFLIVGDALLPPFTSMQGLGESAAISIVEEREKGKFISIEEFNIRCSRVSKTVIELLQNTKSLENIPKTTQISLF